MTQTRKPPATTQQIDETIYRVLEGHESDVIGAPFHSAIIAHARARIEGRGLRVTAEQVRARFYAITT